MQVLDVDGWVVFGREGEELTFGWEGICWEIGLSMLSLHGMFLLREMAQG